MTTGLGLYCGVEGLCCGVGGSSYIRLRNTSAGSQQDLHSQRGGSLPCTPADCQLRAVTPCWPCYNK